MVELPGTSRVTSANWEARETPRSAGDTGAQVVEEQGSTLVKQTGQQEHRRVGDGTAMQRPRDDAYTGCYECGSLEHRASDCEHRWRRTMERDVRRMRKLKGDNWVVEQFRVMMGIDVKGIEWAKQLANDLERERREEWEQARQREEKEAAQKRQEQEDRRKEQRKEAAGIERAQRRLRYSKEKLASARKAQEALKTVELPKPRPQVEQAEEADKAAAAQTDTATQAEQAAAQAKVAKWAAEMESRQEQVQAEKRNRAAERKKRQWQKTGQVETAVQPLSVKGLFPDVDKMIEKDKEMAAQLANDMRQNKGEGMAISDPVKGELKLAEHIQQRLEEGTFMQERIQTDLVNDEQEKRVNEDEENDEEEGKAGGDGQEDAHWGMDDDDDEAMTAKEMKQYVDDAINEEMEERWGTVAFAKAIAEDTEHGSEVIQANAIWGSELYPVNEHDAWPWSGNGIIGELISCVGSTRTLCGDDEEKQLDGASSNEERAGGC